MQIKKPKRRKLKIKRGDEVIIIAGKDKGKRGTVLEFCYNGDKIRTVVSGVNILKKHVKPNKKFGGGIVEKEGSIDISNIMLFNSKAGRGERINFKFLDDGRKVRCFVKSGESIEEISRG